MSRRYGSTAARGVTIGWTVERPVPTTDPETYPATVNLPVACFATRGRIYPATHWQPAEGGEIEDVTAYLDSDEWLSERAVGREIALADDELDALCVAEWDESDDGPDAESVEVGP